VIAETEQLVSAFFQKKKLDPCADKVGSRAAEIHALFHQEHCSLDFILNEGGLKRDLVTSGILSDLEIAFFQSSGPGAIAFCQCAEVFMNALKFGQSAACGAGVFSAEKYFSATSDLLPTFVAKTRSVVYYPPQYSKIYSLEGSFAQMLQGVFSVQGEVDVKRKITTWVVGSKV